MLELVVWCGVAAVLARAALWLLAAVREVLHQLWVTRDIPGPPSYPLVGSFLAVAGPQEELYEKLVALRADLGPTVKLWLGPVLVVIVSRPTDLELVFTDPRLQTKPWLMYASSMEPCLGAGLITMNGADYRRHRRIISPSFAQDVLHGFAPSFNANAHRLVEQLGELADSGEVFDAAPLSRMCTSYTVCETVLSADSSRLESDRRAVVQAVYRGVTLMFHRGIRPWYRWDTLFKLSKHYDDYQEMVRVGDSFVSKVLDLKMEAQAKETLGQAEEAGEPDAQGSGKQGKRKAFLDHLLSSEEGKTLTKDELSGELKHLVAAANSTTSDTLSFFLYCIAIRQDVQAKILEELDAVFEGDREREVEVADLPKLKYLERAFKETLRYFAPAPIYARQPDSDVKLPSGATLPKGCVVLVSPHFTHKDPDIWPDPDVFEPDRFLPHNSVGRHPHAFIPFSAGTRSCIGQRFVMMFLKTAAATVLRRFHVTTPEDGPRRVRDIKPIFSLTLHVKGGARIRVQRRT
ncbi:Cytochrome P450 CYP4 [Frankliniella occidentalis]|uniref:Cytochrome P450 4V2-like n=1 Tax=Frankliniella occidentalis TaxID=133901 RepID=A0A9C6XUX9_FRAOC|nr:cytochrome P450 4V2-like [Frankliniella occidentalis]KAE8737288.1 Cytochrome P450 CYP4 [Frankliniella occidentalis]